MYSVYKRFAAITFVAAATVWSITSCKGSSDNKESEAITMYSQAQQAFDSGDAQGCITLLDSLDKNYSGDVEVMKQSMQLRPKALIIVTRDQLAAADSVINANKAAIDSLKPLMTHVNVPGTEGYMLKSSAVDPAFMNKTGVSPRVSEIGEFYLVSSLNPAGGLHHWSLTAAVGDMIANTDTVRCDGALNFRTGNSEVITFTPAGSRSIGQLVALNPGLPVKIIFNGENGRNKSISLSASQIDAIATAYRYAAAVNDMRDATIELERLNARLAKLQQQAGEQ